MYKSLGDAIRDAEVRKSLSPSSPWRPRRKIRTPRRDIRSALKRALDVMRSAVRRA